MAAISKGSAIAGSFTKLFSNHHFGGGSGGAGRLREDPAPVSSFLASPTRRVAGAVYYSSSSSLYDKNIEDHVCPAVVPDYIVESGTTDNYWGPHPVTGVFGPIGPGSGGSRGLRHISSNDSASPSVLDRTVWFRSGDDDHDYEPPNY